MFSTLSFNRIKTFLIMSGDGAVAMKTEMMLKIVIMHKPLHNWSSSMHTKTQTDNEEDKECQESARTI